MTQKKLSLVRFSNFKLSFFILVNSMFVHPFHTRHESTFTALHQIMPQYRLPYIPQYIHQHTKENMKENIHFQSPVKVLRSQHTKRFYTTAPNTIRRCKMNMRLPEPTTSTRRIIFIAFVISFLPYFFPQDQKPEIYKKKPISPNKLNNKYIGGNLDDIPWDKALNSTNN